MKSKKPSPFRRPISYNDVLKLKAEAKSQGVIEAFVIFFNALRDKEDFDRERLRRSLCLVACQNHPARCGLEDRRKK